MASAPTIHAIPTTYNGITFRSRLEARWAKFLDLLQVPWEYEPQGYDLDGIRYLPDFWLPRSERFFEVKPENVFSFPKQYALAAITRKIVMVGNGDVVQRRVVLISPSDEDVTHEFSMTTKYRIWDDCQNCKTSYFRPESETKSPRYCVRCGNSTDVSELAHRAQNESFWNPPVAAETRFKLVEDLSLVEKAMAVDCSSTSLWDRVDGHLQVIPPQNCEYQVADRVFHENFGYGTVREVIPRGNDFELKIEFEGSRPPRSKRLAYSMLIGKMVAA